MPRRQPESRRRSSRSTSRFIDRLPDKQVGFLKFSAKEDINQGREALLEAAAKSKKYVKIRKARGQDRTLQLQRCSKADFDKANKMAKAAPSDHRHAGADASRAPSPRPLLRQPRRLRTRRSPPTVRLVRGAGRSVSGRSVSGRVAPGVDLEGIPRTSGCYLFRDAAAEVIYVGKAADLRRRVRSHFDSHGRQAVAAGVASVEVILTRSSYEAAVLESSLIRHHRPRLNRADPLDLGLWHLRLSEGPFPRLERIRPTVAETSDPSRVFGPCFSYRETEALIAAVSDYFRLRTCTLDGTGKCARYHAGHCIPVCEEPQRRDRYTRAVAQAAALLRGDTSALEPLRRRISAAAGERRYERAAALTRTLRTLERGAVPQAVLRPGGGDAAVACTRRLPNGRCLATVLRVQGGALVALEPRRRRDRRHAGRRPPRSTGTGHPRPAPARRHHRYPRREHRRRVG